MNTSRKTKSTQLSIPNGIDKMLTSVLAFLSGAGRTLLNLGSSAKSNVQNKINSLLRSLGFSEPATKEERREILEELKEEIEEELEKPNPKFNEVVLRRETDHLKIYRINNTAKIFSIGGDNGIITYIEPIVKKLVLRYYPLKLNIHLNINLRNKKKNIVVPYVLNHTAAAIIAPNRFVSRYKYIRTELLYEFENPQLHGSEWDLDAIRFTDVYLQKHMGSFRDFDEEEFSD